MPYGQFWFDGKMHRPARWIFQQAHGPIGSPQEMVCHHCDRPACVNLLHMYLGNARTNVRDRDSRGRQITFRGESNGRSKLRDADMPEICRRYAEGEILRVIAADYGVHLQTIHRVVKGKRLSATRHPQGPVESGDGTLL